MLPKRITILCCAIWLSSCGAAQNNVPRDAHAVARGPVTYITQLTFGIDSADKRWELHRYVAPDEDAFRMSFGKPGQPDTVSINTNKSSSNKASIITTFDHNDTGYLVRVKKTDNAQLIFRSSMLYDANSMTATTENASYELLGTTYEEYKDGRVSLRRSVEPAGYADSIAFDYISNGGIEQHFRVYREYGHQSQVQWPAQPTSTNTWRQNAQGDRVQEYIDDHGDEPYLDDTITHAYHYDDRENFTEAVRRNNNEPEYMRLRRLFYDERPHDSLTQYYLPANDLVRGHWEGLGAAAGRFLNFDYIPDSLAHLREALPRVLMGYVDPQDSTLAAYDKESYFVTQPGKALVTLGSFSRGPAGVMRYTITGDQLKVNWSLPGGPTIVTLEYQRVPTIPDKLLRAFGWQQG